MNDTFGLAAPEAESAQGTKDKIERYAQGYLYRFREEVGRLETALAAARKRVEIAEQEYRDGKMVTGNADGVPTLMRGLEIFP